MSCVVITGSTLGLGRLTAERCLDMGASVVISAENESGVEAALAELGENPKLAGTVCDVSRREQVESLMAFATERFGQVDAWINNAGVTAPIGRVKDIPIAAGELLIRVNIHGTYYGSTVALRQFESQGRGRLINVVGRGEKAPVPTGNLYASSKAWVRNFTLALHKENEHTGIDICTFNPGFLVTRLTTRVRVMRGHESVLSALKKVIRLIGETPENAANELASLALREGRAPVENGRSRFTVLVPKVFRRIVLKEKPPVDPDDVVIDVVEPERAK